MVVLPAWLEPHELEALTAVVEGAARGGGADFTPETREVRLALHTERRANPRPLPHPRPDPYPTPDLTPPPTPTTLLALALSPTPQLSSERGSASTAPCNPVHPRLQPYLPRRGSASTAPCAWVARRRWSSAR